MSTLEMNVKAEYTPNPNSIKFVCPENFYPTGTLTYNSASEAEGVPVARKLFDVTGVTKVFMMANFVTVDKVDDISWKDIHIEIKETIKTELEEFKNWAKEHAPKPKDVVPGSDDEKRSKVEMVLDKIRPALVADGGNIELVDIVDTDVRLRMVGACGTCPSAMMTMKMGVERALVSELPDIVETVTQVY